MEVKLPALLGNYNAPTKRPKDRPGIIIMIMLVIIMITLIMIIMMILIMIIMMILLMIMIKIRSGSKSNPSNYRPISI